MVQEAKARNASRSLRVIQNSLRSAPGRPIVVVRTSRRDHLFVSFKDIIPANPHIILWKGNADFLKPLDPGVRSAYETIQVPGEGFFSPRDASEALSNLENSVVVFDVPGGSLEKYANVLEFVRALRPRQIVALLGEQFKLLPVQTGKDEKLTLQSPDMEPSYVGLDPQLVQVPGRRSLVSSGR